MNTRALVEVEVVEVVAGVIAGVIAGV